MIQFPVLKTFRAKLFARLPAELDRTGNRSEWGDANRAGAPLGCFLEGPAFDREGNLFCVDVPFGRIFRIAPDGTFSVVAEYDGWPYAVKMHRDGRLFVADYRKGILALDPATGAMTTVVGRHLPVSLKGANDMCFTHDGVLYFTDYGQTDMHDPSGRVLRLSGDRLEVLSNAIPGPNGLVLSPSERVLYVGATRSNQIWRAGIGPAGNLIKMSIFAHLDGGVGPDGLAVDAAGNLLVAHAGRGIVWGYTPHGELIYRIESCGSYETTNLAFGGPDNKRLFITDGEGLIQYVDLPVPGHPLYSHI